MREEGEEEDCGDTAVLLPMANFDGLPDGITLSTPLFRLAPDQPDPETASLLPLLLFVLLVGAVLLIWSSAVCRV